MLKEVLNLIESVDSFYLVICYLGNDFFIFLFDLVKFGNNYRGGLLGFLCIFWDEECERRCLILFDWSGNRLMMFFGNIIKDFFVGFLILIW